MFLDGNRRILNQEVTKADNIGVTIRRFAGYFRNYWFVVLGTVFFIAVSAYTTVLGPALIGQAIDCYISPQTAGGVDNCWFTEVDPAATDSDRVAGVLGIAGLLLGLFIANAIATGLSFFTMRYAGQNVLRNLRNEMMHHIHRLSMGFFAKQEAGDVMSRVTNDMDTVQQMFNFALIQVARGSMLIGFIVWAMLQTNVVYALIALSVAPVMIATTLFFSNQARKAFRKARKEIGSVNADLQESIAGAREVQAFNREAESIAQFQERNEANRAANVRAAVFTAALNPSLQALGFVAIGIVTLAGGLSALNNEPLLGTSVISLGTIFAFIGYVQQLNQPIAQIAILWTNVQNGIAGGERIFDLLDQVPDIQDDNGAKAMPEINGTVEFSNVWAEYVPGEPVLKGIDLKAETGQTVAIVGPTGAGKTTIINMIPRFYDVKDGAVRIDGHDVREVQADTLRHQIGIVLQDTFLFSTTVMDNIRYGRLDATDEEVIAAAKMVAAHDFIERLPDGYETVLGERGSGLSQGQRQLIAIARVALMNPRILILDEATSSVDTRTERMIQAAFEKLLEGRTSFVIAHRLSTIRDADQVLMLKAGEIIERGNHDSLLDEQGAYYDLYMSQFREQDTETETLPQPSGD